MYIMYLHIDEFLHNFFLLKNVFGYFHMRGVVKYVAVILIFVLVFHFENTSRGLSDSSDCVKFLGSHN